jgi:cytidylate kinase
MWCNPTMQADTVAIAALQPRLEELADLLGATSLTLPTTGRDEAEHARLATVRTIREYLIPRLEEPDAPVVAAIVGPAGTGKSTVVNSLANDRISDVGPIRPTTKNPALWAHRDHGNRYWTEFVSRVRDRVGPSVEVVIGEDELTKQLTVIDTPPAEYVAASGRRPALDALALADLCVFVTSASRYADIAAWDFLAEVRWRGVPMLFVLNRLPADRELAVALLNDFAARLHANGLLLEPDAAMVFGITETIGDRWHGGLDPAAVGALRNELGAVSNTAYRNTLVSTTAFTTGRNVADRSRLIVAELQRAAAAAAELSAAVDRAYETQTEEMRVMLAEGALREMARYRTWSEAAVDLTAIITRRAGVAAQDSASAWASHATGARLLEGTGIGLWRHTEDTSWDVQGTLEQWEAELQDLAARHSPRGNLSGRMRRKIAGEAWRLVVDPGRPASRRMHRKLGADLQSFVTTARRSLGDVIASALGVDAARFWDQLTVDGGLTAAIERTLNAVDALLRGEPEPLQAIPGGPEPEGADPVGPLPAESPAEPESADPVDPSPVAPEPDDA